MEKPKKPHKDFPLSPHANGQWCKKVRGKIHYFGTWDNPQAALELWLKEKDYLISGVSPPGCGAKLKDVLNAVLEDRLESVRSGSVTQRHWNALKVFAESAVDILGADAPAELTPKDWSTLRAAWSKTLKPTTLAKRVACIKGVMKFAHGMQYIPQPTFGPAFVPPTARAIRESMAGKERVITRERFAEMLAKADDIRRCCLLVGLNLAYGQQDITNLSPKMIDSNGIVKHPRSKTGVRRSGALWPETLVMLGVLFNRKPSYGSIASWMRLATGPDHTPYDLRHTFATIGDQCTDSRAVDCVMGHSSGQIRDGYQHGIDNERLHAVAEFVRSRML